MAVIYPDRWALITGASAGIGAEFARQLAARGMHLVLVARREDRLQELAHELNLRHGTRCEIIACDLSVSGEARRLFESTQRLGEPIELLVNNAGFGSVATIEDSDPERMLQMISLNCVALTELTYLFLRPMLERQAGAVLNVASVTGFQPVAYMGVYAATKAYVLHFSESLWAETRERGVTVMALCPGTTRTEFFEAAGVEGWLQKHRSQSVDQVVRAALKGLDKGRQYYVSGWINYVLTLAVRLASRKMSVLGSMKYFRPVARSDSVDD